MKNNYLKVKRDLINLQKGKTLLTAIASFLMFIFTGLSSFAQCTPSTTGPWDYIATFNTTGGITNIAHTSTAMATAGYGDFTNVYSVSQLAGSSISFTETYSGNGGHGFNIWVDWNNNQEFETGEKVYASVTMYDTGANGPLQGSFTVPSSAAVGNYKMRVRAQQGTADPSPCGVIDWGEAKDYTITVLSQAEPCTPSTTGPWDYIATFNTTGGITNIAHTSTAMATSGYGNFTNVYSVSQLAGSSISFTETYSGNGGHGFNIWVDWNNNQEFENSEKVYASVTMYDTGANGPLQGSFTIPASAIAGNYRMRVRAQQGTADPSPCGVIDWGEAKDYTISVLQEPEPCTPSTTGPWDYIATFNTTGGISNIAHTSTAMATSGYGDFTDEYSLSQVAGGSISFTETYSGNGGHGFNIWVDWNNNQEFENSEKVYASVTMYDTGANGPLQGAFSIPATVAVGSYRMRVRAQQGTADPLPCGTIAWGEAKDYTITVTAPMGLNPVNGLKDRVIVYAENDYIVAESSHAMIHAISVYDISGRLVYNQKDINKPRISVNDLTAMHQVLLLQIVTDSGTVTKKIVH